MHARRVGIVLCRGLCENLKYKDIDRKLFYVGSVYMEKAENFGKSWSKEEDAKLLGSLKGGKKLVDVAEEHKRTYGAVRRRVRDIAFELHKGGKTVEVIVKMTGLAEKDVQDVIKRRAGKVECDKESVNVKTELLKEIHSLLGAVMKKQEELEKLFDQGECVESELPTKTLEDKLLALEEYDMDELEPSVPIKKITRKVLVKKMVKKKKAPGDDLIG
ncbi:MAG: hypothetical protein Hyperionvirus18_23 [Hyperionvirus sp.]|uniref:Uncharacterized protein n=1 Tax=Hyperionvirus sp. TaxID=2487770 RepID=A0A3G5AA73_9VIRU|nr:MAG: hypothetical protein Hyperionvirus18_23 [Hyperionvirus sp.]